eukprot:2629851-Prorocentrum_lima.AAC.1
MCPSGPGRTARHNALRDAWADILDELHGGPRIETYVESFTKPGKEAWLDLTATTALPLANTYYDITIRHPLAARYVSQAARKSGATAVK